MIYIVFPFRVLLLGSHTVYILSYNDLLVKIIKLFGHTLSIFLTPSAIGRQKTLVCCAFLLFQECPMMLSTFLAASFFFFFLNHPSLWIALFMPVKDFLNSRLKLEWFLSVLWSQPFGNNKDTWQTYFHLVAIQESALKISSCRFGKPVLYQFGFENLLL